MGGDYSQYYEQYWNNYAAWQNYGTYYDPYASSYGDYHSGIEGGSGDSKDSSKEDFEPVEWNNPIDVNKTNKEYIDRSEELWQAIEKSRWSFWDQVKEDE
ncbi:putative tRNA selenocysteine 1-associated protein 1-like [Homarus americanus]|uniref:Putative tRNA selenocysteine 1-associated protein 1-like n=2 Tax=Homarus americanus TaxID=6706 RepID=A0A8J5JTW1_HOMAM|nr:putative tRNA selenocysteine 1-associated protein 1-like [Homarus americanus]